MTDKEALENLKYIKENGLYQELNSIDITAIETVLNLIQTQQEEIEKKDKVINLILEKQAGSSCLNIYCKKRNKKDKCLECVKEYFINKVEKER